MISCLAVVASAQVAAQSKPVVFDDWQVNKVSDEHIDLFTSNGSESALGRVCNVNTSKCFYYLNPQLKCQDGDPYVGIANSPNGAKHVSFVCTQFERQFLMVVKDYEGFKEILAGDTGEIAMAIPMAGSTLKVLRFSLRGYERAHNAISEAFNRQQPAVKRRDTVL